MEEHRHAVCAIAERIQEFHKLKIPFRIYHGSTNSTRSQSFTRGNTVDTSKLNHVLDINIRDKTALVQPNVAMDQLVEATLACGMVPPVVMEFPGITVGGAFSGTAAESSSFKHGIFEHTIVSIEIVLGDGQIMEASDTRNQDLFEAAAGAFGTLGVVTLLRISLLDAKKFVRLTYQPVSSFADAIDMVKNIIKDRNIDFCDGIMFSATTGVIISGFLTDDVGENMQIQHFQRSHDPWHYLHAKDVLYGSRQVHQEVVPLVDYLFRYDRGAFWTASYAFRYFLVPFNYITRFLLDRFMRTRVMYHALHESGLADQYIVQDLALPVSGAQHFLEYCDQTLNIYPLWLCPLRRSKRTARHFHLGAISEHSAAVSEGWLLNVGLWGPGPAKHEDFVHANRDIESKVRQFGGVKVLYAHAYYTKKEFESIYSQDRYAVIRKRYAAEALPSLYDKVKMDVDDRKRAASGWKSVRPIGGLYGVVKATLGHEYLLLDERRSIRPMMVLSAAVLMLCVFLGVPGLRGIVLPISWRTEA